MRKVVYPGSFDPISNGHLDIIERLAKTFDEVHVLVSFNLRKKSTFTVNKRVEMIKKVTKHLSNVKVSFSDDLIVYYCKKNDINLIVRGLRNYQDYENEFTLYQYNKDLDPNVETILMFPSSKNQFVSSSAIKELIVFGADISKYVPSEIMEDIKKQYNK
ncbi:MAG: pantetheine-phosphate adenylyltransferase [Anaeroplasmataceae bacterium]